ncbi:MAG: Gx transporter family protein [Oscillospiraceae bacterium]|nr:Gx transporter family protein [Oscillospiraceae bacterium]
MSGDGGGRKKRDGSAARTAFLGMFLALSILASYVERVVPSPVPAVPGIKLGLANIAPLFLMYTRSNRAAFGLNVLRCLLSGLLFTGVWGTLYALSGAIVSFGAMAALKRARAFGIVGVSALGGVCHNAGQLSLAALAVRDARLFYYLPVLIISGVAAGVFVGWVAGVMIRRIPSPAF